MMVPARPSKAAVKIIEQPASNALRFRYKCEGRSAGSIPGVTSTPEIKTFPAIKIVGYQGRAAVVVSCVTKNAPHRPHPHNLVGREWCNKGVCTLEVPPKSMSVTFFNLGIQCVKRNEIEASLKIREEIMVDPFRTGFAHRNQPSTIDLNSVRLCFQVILEDDKGQFTVPLAPVISQPIYDKKSICDLVITKISDCASSVAGGEKDIILLCEKVAKDDIEIRFYEERNGELVWEDFGVFEPSQVHKQTAIWFRAPCYRSLEVKQPVNVFIQLRRPSDGATSEPLPFELLPLDSVSQTNNMLTMETTQAEPRASAMDVAVLPEKLNILNPAVADIQNNPWDSMPINIPGGLSSLMDVDRQELKKIPRHPFWRVG